MADSDSQAITCEEGCSYCNDSKMCIIAESYAPPLKTSHRLGHQEAPLGSPCAYGFRRGQDPSSMSREELARHLNRNTQMIEVHISPDELPERATA